MIGFYVCLGVERTQRFTYPGARVRIGSAGDNDLILRDGDVEDYACVVERRGDRCMIERAGEPRELSDGADFEVGDYVLVLAITERTWQRLDVSDEVERRLVESIQAHDDDSRLVYADWLEERGHARRAEFLRVQEALAGLEAEDDRFEGLAKRLRSLATLIDIGWRRRVGRPAIEGCAFDLECPKQWSALEPTEQPAVRHCASCNQDVYYCATVDEAQRHARRNQCVAIDVTAPRRPGDLVFGIRMKMGLMIG